MAIRRITIDFNEYMGQVTLRTNDTENVMTYDLDYKADLHHIVKEYWDEIRGK